MQMVLHAWVSFQENWDVTNTSTIVIECDCGCRWNHKIQSKQSYENILTIDIECDCGCHWNHRLQSKQSYENWAVTNTLTIVIKCDCGCRSKYKIQSKQGCPILLPNLIIQNKRPQTILSRKLLPAHWLEDQDDFW